MKDKIVIIPTYNEKENIEAIIRKVFSLEGDFHVLIIEDNIRMKLPDGKTPDADYPENYILKNQMQIRAGTAYIDGF
jgi:dolichol-phosphate mannosyltransferase